MATKDTRYFLSIEIVKNLPEYTIYKLHFDHHKFFIVKSNGIDVKIFNVDFCCFITSEVFPAKDMDSGKETTIKGSDYLQSYIDGYLEGCKYFKTKHERDPYLLSEENKQLYIEAIKENFYHSGYKGLRGIRGWNYIVASIPAIITHANVKEYGYYAGIVNSVYEHAKEYPKMFKDFFTIDQTRKNLSKYDIQFIREEIIPAQQRMIEEARGKNDANLIWLIKQELANMEMVLKERMQQEGIELTPPNDTTSTVTEKKPLQLIDLFKEPLQFKQIIEILADNDFCDRHSYVWKDQSKGLKETFAALMKDLHNKLYLKRDFSKDGAELKEIAKHTFSLSISVSTARKAKHKKLAADLKDLIPYASTLP